MGKGEGLSIGNINESLRKRAGELLVFITGIALAASGCAAPTPCNAEQQEQKTLQLIRRQTQKATPILTGSWLTRAASKIVKKESCQANYQNLVTVPL